MSLFCTIQDWLENNRQFGKEIWYCLLSLGNYLFRFSLLYCVCILVLKTFYYLFNDGPWHFTHRRLLDEKIYLFLNFHWNILDFQGCVSFSCTAWWINYINTYIHSLKKFFSIQVITEYRIEFSMLHRRSLFIIALCIGMGVWSSRSQLFPFHFQLCFLAPGTLSLFSPSVSFFCK